MFESVWNVADAGIIQRCVSSETILDKLQLPGAKVVQPKKQQV
jgi:hypothetical protein